MFPSESTQSKMLTKFVAFNSTVENFTGEPNENVFVLIVEETALRDFFNKKYEHSDKVNLILSNLENKKHKRKSRYGHSGIHYRNYRQGFN